MQVISVITKILKGKKFHFVNHFTKIRKHKYPTRNKRRFSTTNS